jgi:hypothetical protein
MHVSQQKRIAGHKKREAILRYMLANPGIKQTQLCDKFGLSAGAMSVHVRHIRRGWRPEGWQDQEWVKKLADSGDAK